MTYEQALASSALMAYGGAKSLAEKAVWELADAHKDLDITTFCPPFLYGPFAPGFSIPTPDYMALSTALRIYQFLTPTCKFPPFAGTCAQPSKSCLRYNISFFLRISRCSRSCSRACWGLEITRAIHRRSQETPYCSSVRAELQGRC